MNQKDFHGIIVKESIIDPSILDKVAILGRQSGKDWELMKVCIGAHRIEQFIREVARNLKTKDGVPFYAHFYSEEELVVVFPSKVFHIKTDKATWKPVIDYGISFGIPIEQLDFYPCRLTEEIY